MYLKSLLRMYGIRNIDIACAIGKTSPYISHFLSGHAIPSRAQYDKILTLLKHGKMTREEEDKLNKLFIMLKTGIGSNHTGLPLEEVKDVMEAELLSRWRSMTPEQQKHIINIIGKFMIDNALSKNR